MKLSDTQLMILSAASRHEDQAVVLPPQLKGNAAKKTVDKLVREGLVQESRAKDDMPVRRRDGDNRPYALRITKTGLEAIAADRPEEPGHEVDAKVVAGAERGIQAVRSKSPTKRQPKGTRRHA